MNERDCVCGCLFLPFMRHIVFVCGLELLLGNRSAFLLPEFDKRNKNAWGN